MFPSKIVELTLLISWAPWLLHESVWCTEASEGSQTNWMPNEDSWHYWWSYSGPAYWGLLNLDWYICDKGRQQSPIDIETKTLIYDPQLSQLKVDNNLISGLLYNDGHSIVFNGSMSPFLFDNNAVHSENVNSGANRKLNSSSQVSKRSLSGNNDNDLGGIFGQLNSPSPDAASSSSSDDLATTKPMNSNSVLRDLSNSVELSIKQNDRLEPAIDASRMGPNSLFTGGDTENEFEQANSAADSERNQLAEDPPSPPPTSRVHFTGAGLAYQYRFEALYLRFGLDSRAGSEHRINGHAYAGELQLMAYNSLLYKSYADASAKPRGLLGLAILIETTMPSNNETSVQKTGNGSRVSNPKRPNLNSVLEILVAKSSELKHRGSSVVVRNLNLSALLPETDFFVTYEGSLTTPGCQESVNWLVMNKPLYITPATLDILRSISADEQSSPPTGTLIADNIRPVQAANYRLVRTNIRPSSSSGSNENPETCQRLWTKYEYKQARG